MELISYLWKENEKKKSEKTSDSNHEKGIRIMAREH